MFGGQTFAVNCLMVRLTFPVLGATLLLCYVCEPRIDRFLLLQMGSTMHLCSGFMCLVVHALNLPEHHLPVPPGEYAWKL
jgi:hypothetical protein